MKTSFLLLATLTLAPVAALAQAKPALRVSVEPAAKALLDKATAQYRVASDVRFDLVKTENVPGTELSTLTRSHISFCKPNLFRVEKNINEVNKKRSSTFVSDGKSTYTVYGKVFEQDSTPTEARRVWREALPSVTGYFIATMLEGKSVLDDIQKDAPPRSQGKMIVTVALPTIMNGESLRGVRINFSDKPTKNTAVIYIWFGSDGLLRRISANELVDRNGHHRLSEVVSNQQLNPKFTPNTFKFDPTGLQPSS